MKGKASKVAKALAQASLTPAPIAAVAAAPAPPLPATSASSDQPQPTSAVKTAMKVVRSFRVEQVLAATSTLDVVLSKQEGESLFSFLAFPGSTPDQVAHRILQIDESQRHVHTVFGRTGAKLDLAMDLDFGFCEQPKGHADYYTRDSVVLDVLQLLKEYYTQTLKVAMPTDLVVLDGNSTKKHSVHLHLRSPDGVFPDYNAMREVLGDVNSKMKIPAIDLGVLRPNGMMRIAFTPKYNEPSRKLLPLKAVDAGLRDALQFMQKDLTEVDIVARSLINNPLASGKAFRGTGSATRTTGYDEFGHAVTPFMMESKKWLRFREATTAVKRYPLSISEEYDTWIRVGLALHSFGADDHIKEHWKSMSARCRHKYNPAVCDKLWEKFAQRPNCFNWRRGYNYLVRTLGKGAPKPTATDAS